MTFSPENRLILVDCDEVLLDWSMGFRQFCIDEKGLAPSKDGPCDWDMRNWLGVDDDAVIRQLVHEFNHESDAFAHLPAIGRAEEFVPMLAETGHRFVAITCCATEPDAVKRRKDNLKRLFGDVFDAVHCLPFNTDKGPTLRRYAPTLWVEDNVKNAQSGLDAGHLSYVMRRLHNRPAEATCDGRFRWVDDWEVLVRETGLPIAA